MRLRFAEPVEEGEDIAVKVDITVSTWLGRGARWASQSNSWDDWQQPFRSQVNKALQRSRRKRERKERKRNGGTFIKVLPDRSSAVKGAREPGSRCAQRNYKGAKFFFLSNLRLTAHATEKKWNVRL